MRVSVMLLLTDEHFSSSRLHYELHIVHWNCALSMLLAIVFYLVTIPAREDRVG